MGSPSPSTGILGIQLTNHNYDAYTIRKSLIYFHVLPSLCLKPTASQFSYLNPCSVLFHHGDFYYYAVVILILSCSSNIYIYRPKVKFPNILSARIPGRNSLLPVKPLTGARCKNTLSSL